MTKYWVKPIPEQRFLQPDIKRSIYVRRKNWISHGISVSKVLPTEGTLPKFEITAQGSGKIAGVDVQFMGTYHAEMKANGSMYGECPNSAILMAADGIATLRASGVGRTEPDGSTKFRGIVYIETTAPSLMSLNGKAIVQEYDVDAAGNANWEMWHWA